MTIHLDVSVLDNLIWHTLSSRQAQFALAEGDARRFALDVAPFVAIEQPSDQTYASLARLVAEGTPAILFTADRVEPPVDLLRVDFERPLTQMIVHEVRPPTGTIDVIDLGPDDVPEMLALVELTQPGPCRPRTIELGRYVGIRRNGDLVAMAGERMKPDGFTEISAVCTHPDWQGRGFASELVSIMAEHIQVQGDTAILHTGSSNQTAISVYRNLGFELRRELWVTAVDLPVTSG